MSKFKVIDELWLNVQQCLLAKPGMLIHQIKNIISHPQAMAQSKIFLQKNCPNAQLITWQDTALAAQDLAAGHLIAESAVIASAQAAKIYGLEVIAENIQDDNPNLTAFIIVKNDQEIAEVINANP